MANFAARTSSVTKHDNVTIIESDTQSMGGAEVRNYSEIKPNDDATDDCVLFDSDLKPKKQRDDLLIRNLTSSLLKAPELLNTTNETLKIANK